MLKTIIVVVSIIATATASHAQTPFDGAYVAITGGYDIAAPNQPAPPTYNYFNSTATVGGFDLINGSKVGGLAGYNVTSGALLVGFEARAQYAFGSSASTNTYFSSQTLPYYIGSCYGCGPGGYDQIYPITLSYGQRYEERYSRPYGADLSLRAGIVFDQWLVFGRVGVGAEMSRVVTTDDRSSTTTCNRPVVTATALGSSLIGYNYSVTGCGSITNGAVTRTTVERITPTVTLAAGIERNFESMFVRVEAELMLHFPVLSSQVYYSPAVNVAVGYRF